MRIVLDKARCIGSGNCVLVTEEIFTLGADGTVELVRQPDEGLREKVEQAARGCPGAVISIVEDEESPRDPA